jgi:sterol 14-demethylase
MLSGGLPLLGHALELRSRPVELFQRGRDLYGEMFSLRLPGSHAIMMSGPKAQQKFFRLSDEDMDMREVYKLMTPIFGKGIAYDAEPEIMREQLAFFHDALRETRLRTYAQGFVEEAEDFFGKWGDEGVVDLYQVGNELTIYTSSRSLLGRNFRQKLSGEFQKLYYEMEGGLNLLAFFAPKLPLVPAFRRRDAARKRLGELIASIVADRREHGTGDEDFLQTLMDARYKDGRALTEDEMTGLLLAIMFAGHHTSGVTFAWTGILLNQNPEWIGRLREEQKDVLGDRSDLTLEDLRAMSLLECTIKETLRMYPPIIMMMRRVLKPFEYGGYAVPENAMIMTSPAMAHRIPEVFKDPNRFDPDRFGPERDEDKKNPMGWISFGGGRHRCMGIVFAQLQLRAVWSHLLRNFDFELLEPRYEPDYDRLLVGPRSPCRARYRRRKQKTVVAVPA